MKSQGQTQSAVLVAWSSPSAWCPQGLRCRRHQHQCSRRAGNSPQTICQECMAAQEHAVHAIHISRRVTIGAAHFCISGALNCSAAAVCACAAQHKQRESHSALPCHVVRDKARMGVPTDSTLLLNLCAEVFYFGLAEDDVRVRRGRLEDVRLGDHEKNLRSRTAVF
eukprot:6214685-Pleurochrysis_carterae.AAC.1